MRPSTRIAATRPTSRRISSGRENPKIGIGVAWPNAKAYRYEVESIPIIDGGDGTCTRYSNAAGKVSNWWTYAD